MVGTVPMITPFGFSLCTYLSCDMKENLSDKVTPQCSQTNLLCLDLSGYYLNLIVQIYLCAQPVQRSLTAEEDQLTWYVMLKVARSQFKLSFYFSQVGWYNSLTDTFD